MRCAAIPIAMTEMRLSELRADRSHGSLDRRRKAGSRRKAAGVRDQESRRKR